MEVRIVVGVGGYHTDPVVLKQLDSTTGIELKVYGGSGPPLYHPKLYLFQRQHWRRCLIGSMNFTRNGTRGGTNDNIESVYSFEDKPGMAEREFERFWNSADAKPFSGFDCDSYTNERRRLLAAVKKAEATAVLEADVIATADNRVQVDPLREGWKKYVAELKAVPEERRKGCFTVLDNCHKLVNRDWRRDLNETELDLMFGTRQYSSFGNLQQLKQNQSHFQGTENRSQRLDIGEALKRAMKLPYDPPQSEVEGVVKQLLKVNYCGGALATRLLVLARPDLFVSYNVKSFKGLQKRFNLPVSNGEFETRIYVYLLKNIWTQNWFTSPEPEDPSEREFWKVRAALIDLLVYDETSTPAK